MTKRIVALLVAVIMAVSCFMLVSCSKEESKTSEKISTSGATSTPTSGETSTSETSTPATSETSSGEASGEESGTDEPSVVEGDGFYDALEATEVTCDMYSTETPWENWNGRYQFLPQFYKEECDPSENYGTEDYEWKWDIYAAPAADTNNEESAFAHTEGYLDAKGVYDWGDGHCIYRVQTGSFTANWVVGTEYEVIIVLTKGDEKFKTQVYITWTQSSADCWECWKKGVNIENGEEKAWTDYETPIERVNPHDFNSNIVCDF